VIRDDAAATSFRLDVAAVRTTIRWRDRCKGVASGGGDRAEDVKVGFLEVLLVRRESQGLACLGECGGDINPE
jgi:hypothetical protein